MAVEFKFTGDSNQLAREYDKLVRKADKLEKKNAALAAKSKQAEGAQRRNSAAASRGFDAAATGVLKWAAGYVTLQGAIGLVNTALQEQTRLAEAAQQTHLLVAGSQAEVLKNIGDVSDDDANAFLYKLDQIRKDSKFSSIVPIQQAASSVLSATGGDQQRTLDIVAAITPLFGTKPEDMSDFGGSLGDVMKASGIPDAKANAALMLAIQGQARFTDLSAFKNVAPVLAAADVATGGPGETAAEKMRDTREAAAAFAAIGSRAGDPDGNVTKTATANLIANLKTVTDAAVKSGKVAPESVDTFKERLDYVRANPDLKPEVLKSGFKGAIKPVIDEFLSSPDSGVSAIYDEALKVIQASTPALDRKTKQLAGLTPELQTKTAVDASAGNIQDFERNAAVGGQATAQQILQNTLEKTRPDPISGYLSDKNQMLGFGVDVAFRGRDPAQNALARLEQREQQLLLSGLPGRVALQDPEQRLVQARENRTPEQNKIIDAQVRLLDEQQEVLKQMIKARTANQAGAARREATLPVE